MAALPNANSLRILSIDGGGMKGYTTLLILKRIMHAMKLEAKKEGIDLADDPKPCDVFDLIVGTSTGGLIAVMLGRLHMNVDECIQQYEVLGKNVFGKMQWAGQTGKFAKGMLNLPFYDINSLQTAIKSVLQLKNLEVQEDFHENAPVCKTMVCVTRKASTTAQVLRNYYSEDSTQTNSKCTIWEVASATAAAPMFFKSVKFKAGGEVWCDGGLHRNNPINVALTELQLETDWKNKPIGCLLSLGTGAPRIQGVSDNLAKFLKASVDIMTDAEKIADDFAMSKEGRELADTRRYFRFSVVQGMEDLQLDEYKESELMKALTDRYLGKIGSGNEVDQCAKSLLLPDQNWQEMIEDRPKFLPYDKCLHFVERKTYSAELHRFFNPKTQGPRRFVLWGLGGSGKTQIALQYAQSMRKRLSVFWVRADSFANFVNDFSHIVLEQLNPSKGHENTSQDLHVLARGVTAKLEKDPDSWLLVLDNADNFDIFVETAGGRNAISSYIPKSGRVLITTRDRRLQGTVAPSKDGLQVKPMDSREARDLFIKSIPDDLSSQSSLALVDELLGLLGNLPLAIAQAAANITDQQRPVQEYITAYRDKRKRMQLMERPIFDSQTQDPRTSHQSVLVTYEMSFESLEQHHQASARCLNYFGFCHWQKIPKSCIRGLPWCRDLEDNEFHNMIKHLLQLSMIELVWNDDGNEYSVHPVIHERISGRLSLEDKVSYLSDSIQLMVSMFPPFLTEGDEGNYYASCRYLQSHTLLQINLATEIGLKSGDLARLNKRCADFLRLSGMVSASINLATQAVANAQEVWESQSHSTIDAYVSMANSLHADAQHREAYNVSVLASDLLECAKFDDEAVDDLWYSYTRRLLGNIKGIACRRLGKFKEAEDIANELIRWGNGLSEVYTFDDRLSIVHNHIALGRIQRAQIINNELLRSMSEQLRVKYRMVFLRVYCMEAMILRHMRVGSDAEPAVSLVEDDERAILKIFQEVFDEYQIVLPIIDPHLWVVFYNLLDELVEQGKISKAARILVSLLIKTLGSGVRFEGRIIKHLCHVLHKGLDITESLHKTRDARQGPPGLPIANLLAQMIALIGSTPGSLSQESYSLCSFARYYICVGNPCRAEDLLREALVDKNSEERNRNPEGRIHYLLMWAIAQQGRIDVARRYWNTHLALIAPEESKHSDLDSTLRFCKNEKELYDMAKGILTAREPKVPESWWTEHRRVLNRAQLRYGLLIPANAEQGPYSFEDAPDPPEEKQKQKSRGLAFMDKLHRSPNRTS